MADKVKVAVRVRPFNRREDDLETECVVEMADNQTVLRYPGGHRGKQPKTFAFDNCFWSAVYGDPHYADQDEVYKSVGIDVLENAFKGYNACIFAYGQTGSGKSYTMMGSPGEKRGVIPRLCCSLFERIQEQETESLIFKVEVSYMEIYNEKVRDLLDPKGSKHNLRVREHNILGPYVDGLSTLAVSSFEQIESLMEEGNKSRTVAATNMNSESSRSHAVFNIKVTQTLVDLETGVSGEKVSKVSLVDLAGSERVLKSGAVGKRLEEGANINRSLTTLGMVISALADQGSSHGRASIGGGPQKGKFVPYRDSVLTWLLKDNLGGNSKTVMIATISPAADNFEETLSTLRYADRAKRIVNHAVVNEDPNAKIIRELRMEVEALRSQIKDQNQAEDLRDRLAESEKLMSEITRSWEERLKETERVHQTRQQEFERMGIQIGSSGIKVSEGKFHLVNLNADPSMNELLVYYLKDQTVIGRISSSSPSQEQPDILLQGLGVQVRHAVFTIEGNQLWIEPFEDARTCVNGSVIISKTPLQNGARILIGNNHFFRVNCPKESRGMVSESAVDDSNGSIMGKSAPIIDYDFALQEIFSHDKESDTIALAVAEIERQHQMDKEEALERQRKIFEEQIQNLRQSQWSPQTPFDSWQRGAHTPSQYPYLNTPGLTPSTPYPSTRGSRVKDEYDKWIKDRDEMFKTSLSRLKEDIVKANSLMREANLMAADMGKQTQFSVTLQIPAENLTPSKIKKGAFVSEPAILVKRKSKGSQVWSMEKLENKLIDMRELYEDWKDQDEEQQAAMARELDPFFESHESHSLIGVANAFLEVLFHDVRLDYQVPIISQQGEVAGRLHVEIYRLKSSSDECQDQPDSDTQSVSSESDSVPSGDYGRKMECRVRIKEATGLPPALSHFVFCQYTFWNNEEPIVVPPTFDPNSESSNQVHQPQGLTFKFDHEKDFTVVLTDEFLEHLHEGALSVEVWGHKVGPSINLIGERGSDVERLQLSKTKSLQERWAEVTRRVKLWVEILEMNDVGQYVPVEVQKSPDLYTGGVYQLKQGQQRRVSVSVQVDENDSGLLPLVCQQISSVAIGCVCGRNRAIQKPLDSYQEADLDTIKEQWDKALQERRSYLEDQIQKLMKKPDKNEDDVEREQALISQWFALTEERNAVYIPAPNSNIPGAPADWDPPPGIESHIPVIFLNVDQEDLNNTAQCAGVHSILPKEHCGKLFNLPVRPLNEPSEHGEVDAIATWDSSIHEHVALNRVTPAHERVYAILKVVVVLSYPAEMELILRKRLCFNVYKKAGFAKFLVDKFMRSEGPTGTGVLYDLVAHVPKSSLDPEDRSTLALMAAKGEETGTDGESYIEKYTKGISVVESILALDRLRQEVVIRDLLAKQGKKRPGASIKRAASMPTAINAPLMNIGRQNTTESSAMILSEKSDEKPMLVTSLVSPQTMSGSGKLLPPRSTMAAVQEENNVKSGQIEASDADKNVVALSAVKVPDRSGQMRQSTTCDSLVCDSQAGADRNNSMGSSTSSGYGSQVLSSRSDDSADGSVVPPTHSVTINGGANIEDDRVSADQDSDVTVVATPASTPAVFMSENGLTEGSSKPTERVSVSVDGVENDRGGVGTAQNVSDGVYDVTEGGQVREKESAEENDGIGSVAEESANFSEGGSKITERHSLGSLENERSQSESSGNMTEGREIDPNRTIEPGNLTGTEEKAPEPAEEVLAEVQEVSDFSESAEIPEIVDSSLKEHSVENEIGANQDNEPENNGNRRRDSEPTTEGLRSPLNTSLSLSVKGLELSTYSDYGAKLMDVSTASSLPENSSELASSRDDSLAGEDFISSQESIDCSSSIQQAEIPNWLIVNSAVLVLPDKRQGTVRYVGATDFASGLWVGVELDSPHGDTNGEYDGIRYFSCSKDRGVFIRMNLVAPNSSAKIAAVDLTETLDVKSAKNSTTGDSGSSSSLDKKSVENGETSDGKNSNVRKNGHKRSSKTQNDRKHVTNSEKRIMSKTSDGKRVETNFDKPTKASAAKMQRNK